MNTCCIAGVLRAARGPYACKHFSSSGLAFAILCRKALRDTASSATKSPPTGRAGPRPRAPAARTPSKPRCWRADRAALMWPFVAKFRGWCKRRHKSLYRVHTSLDRKVSASASANVHISTCCSIGSCATLMRGSLPTFVAPCPRDGCEVCATAASPALMPAGVKAASASNTAWWKRERSRRQSPLCFATWRTRSSMPTLPRECSTAAPCSEASSRALKMSRSCVAV
mmetsp:Transcript_36038/g.99381  ORF Transcript_36038/g.99381 Transcript_36038/m.99381 type:complete len:227 (+) Transcript_36038:415-1095(+)